MKKRKKSKPITIELTQRERYLISKYGYPFEDIQRQIEEQTNNSNPVDIIDGDYWWEQVANNLAITINEDVEDGPLLEELDTLLEDILYHLRIYNETQGKDRKATETPLKDGSAKNVLNHLRRVQIEGESLLTEKPLDELTHARWCIKVEKYLEAKFHAPQNYKMDIVSGYQMPNPLDSNTQNVDYVEWVVSRADAGRELTQSWMNCVSSAIERLELYLDWQ